MHAKLCDILSGIYACSCSCGFRCFRRLQLNSEVQSQFNSTMLSAGFNESMLVDETDHLTPRKFLPEKAPKWGSLYGNCNNHLKAPPSDMNRHSPEGQVENVRNATKGAADSLSNDRLST
jgi:hypothetical protein